MNQKTFTFLTLLLCLLLQSNFIYAQDNFIEVISNKSIKFSKEGQEKLNRVKNQKLYQEPQIVQFRDIEKVIKEKNLEFVLPNYSCKLSFEYQSGEYEYNNNYHWYSGTATTIRMTVTGANNVTQTQYIQTTSYSAPNSFSCSGNTGNGFRTENKVVATVSPNPIEGKSKLYVELPKEDAQTQILIVDSFGKTIQTLDTSKFTQKGEFDISGLPSGLYYISIRSQLNSLHSITIHVK
jgi:hypothetical protein